MNQDTFEGKWNQFKGEVKRQWGKLTDDDVQRVEGNYDKFVGKLQERYGYEKERAQREAEEFFDRHPTADK